MWAPTVNKCYEKLSRSLGENEELQPVEVRQWQHLHIQHWETDTDYMTFSTGAHKSLEDNFKNGEEKEKSNKQFWDLEKSLFVRDSRELLISLWKRAKWLECRAEEFS